MPLISLISLPRYTSTDFGRVTNIASIAINGNFNVPNQSILHLFILIIEDFNGLNKFILAFLLRILRPIHWGQESNEVPSNEISNHN